MTPVELEQMAESRTDIKRMGEYGDFVEAWSIDRVRLPVRLRLCVRARSGESPKCDDRPHCIERARAALVIA